MDPGIRLPFLIIGSRLCLAFTLVVFIVLCIGQGCAASGSRQGDEYKDSGGRPAEQAGTTGGGTGSGVSGSAAPEDSAIGFQPDATVPAAGSSAPEDSAINPQSDAEIILFDASATDSGVSQITDSGAVDTARPDGSVTSCSDDNTVYDGNATWYELATPLVNCSYETYSLPQYYAAINEEDYDGAGACGRCARVTHAENRRSLEVLIVDQCPFQGNEQWCYPGSHHVDLNQAAFQQLDDLVRGHFPIQWQYIPCQPAGNISYHFHADAGQYWLAVQVRDHRYAIASIEVQVDGLFRALTREDWNYWTGSDIGPGPYTLRVTDIHGRSLIDVNIPLSPGQDVPGSGQFPPCD